GAPGAIGSTTSVYAQEPVVPSASVAVAVKLKLPACVGVPLRVPSVARPMPVGSVPVIANVYPGVPPLATSVCEYMLPKVAAGSAAGVSVIGGGATESVRVPDVAENGPVPVELSVAVTLKSKLPSARGVPLIVPSAARLSPVG